MSRIEEPLAHEMFEALHPLLMSSITPIGGYPAESGDPHPLGTGTLFAIADRHFLVTASHVIARIGEVYGGRMCVYGTDERLEEGTRLIAVSVGGTTHRSADDTAIDVAVTELDAETVAGLASRQFLRMTDVALRPEPGGAGWVVGFPNEYNRRVRGGLGLVLDPLVVMTGLPQDDGYGMLHFNPEYNFVVDANRSGLRYGLSGETATLPDRFEGISGSAVWQTWWPSRDRLDRPWAGRVRVVGVQTGYARRRSLIVATTWGHVAWLIYNQYPDLRPVLDMHFGRGLFRVRSQQE